MNIRSNYAKIWLSVNFGIIRSSLDSSREKINLTLLLLLETALEVCN